MTGDGLVVRGKSRRKYNSYQGEISPSVPNAANRGFHAEKPNEKWLADITEFAIPAGKAYLSPIVDCFDGMPPWLFPFINAVSAVPRTTRSADLIPDPIHGISVSIFL